MCQDKSAVKKQLNSSANKFLENSVEESQHKNVPLFHDSSVVQCRDKWLAKSAALLHDSSVPLFQDSSASQYLDSSVKWFQ